MDRRNEKLAVEGMYLKTNVWISKKNTVWVLEDLPFREGERVRIVWEEDASPEPSP